HIIDPRTGRPAKTDVLAVTMLADRTVTAEIHAKAVLILGVEEGLRYLAQRPALEGLIIDHAGDIHLTPGLLARDLDLTPGSTSDAAGILPSIPDYSIPDHVESDSHAI
ncbi:MAG: FAD:protein FMN transferase, partial [Caldilineaceae bacterium]|nr:FAD:protein FMN transferase [Caldilineaceae bacterium]